MIKKTPRKQGYDAYFRNDSYCPYRPLSQSAQQWQFGYEYAEWVDVQVNTWLSPVSGAG